MVSEPVFCVHSLVGNWRQHFRGMRRQQFSGSFDLFWLLLFIFNIFNVNFRAAAMGRNYVKKTGRGEASSESLFQAFLAKKERRLSFREAAKAYGCKHQTVAKQYKKFKDREDLLLTL